MKKFQIMNIVNMLFRLTIIFLICLVWCRYFIKTLWISITVTCILTILIDFIFHFFNKRKHGKIQIKKEEQNLIEEYTNTFIFSTQQQNLQFFNELAATKHSSKIYGGKVIINHTNIKIALFTCFSFKDFTTDNLVEIYNKCKNVNRIIVCTNTVEDKAYSLAKTLNIETIILDKESVYTKLLKQYNYFPHTTSLKTAEKTKINDVLSYALNKNRTKGYFFSSIVLLFSSLIVPYKLYYVIFASLLLVLSFVSFVNPKFNKKQPTKILEV